MIDILLTLALVIAVAGLLTFLAHLILGVPYVPTPRWIVERMIDEARLRGDETVVDLGAGDGRMLIYAKRRFPHIRAIGCELIPTIWLLGFVRCLLSGQRINLRLGSALTQDLRQADVLLLYVTPTLLLPLMSKLRAELKPGTRIISHAFALPGVQGERLEMQHGRRMAVMYSYRWTPVA